MTSPVGHAPWNTVAIVTARGGSKRIPLKNIRPFLGVPLLARTIETLRACGAFDAVIVSTDHDGIAAVARGGGALVPFIRPDSLSDDHTGTTAVMAHAVAWLAEHLGQEPDRVLCAYPAAVFMTVDDLKASLALLDGDTDYVVSATTFPAPVQRALRRRADGTCELVWPENERARSQDLEELFHDAGQFYWGTRQAWLEQRSLFGARSSLYRLPRHRVQDIDTEEDWLRAEALFRAMDGAVK